MSMTLSARQEPVNLTSFVTELVGAQVPVSNEPGTWLAAFAPVGRTGFAVIVQSRENAVLQVNEHLTRRLPWWLVSFSVSVSLLWRFLRELRYRTYA
jgi:hypothetical protein